MPKYVLQIREIGNNVERHAGKEVRDRVMQGSEEVKDSSSPQQVSRWVKAAMERLDQLADEETRCRAMMDCGRKCADVHKTAEKAAARRARFATLDEFLEAEERHPQPGTRLVREGDVVYQFYAPHSYRRPVRCYCSLVNGLPEGETISPTYCQCSRGFAQRTWEAIVGRPVQVEILGSCVCGAQECKFAIHL